MNSEDMTFGEEFFDMGKKDPGVYKIYRFEELYPEFQILATWVKNTYNPKRILDVGCAKGFLVKALTDLGVEAYGVDVSEYAISNAPADIRPNLLKVDLVKDVLPFADGYFGFVTLLGTIEYLDNHQNAVREIKRVLKRGGGLYLTTLMKKDPRDKFRINMHSRDFWIKELQAEGFRVVPQKLNSYLKMYYDYRRKYLSQELDYNIQEATLAFKIARLIFQRGGYIGREFVLLMSRFMRSRYISLLFEKESI